MSNKPERNNLAQKLFKAYHSSAKASGTSVSFEELEDDELQRWARVSDAASRNNRTGSIGWAMDLLREGVRVRRSVWEWKGMWISLHAHDITPIVMAHTELPDQHSAEAAIQRGGSIVVHPTIALFTAKEELQLGWTPSTADLMADDWEVLEYTYTVRK